MIDEVMYQLLSRPTVTSIVGSDIFPVTKKDAAGCPYIIYSKVSTERHYNDSGEVSLTWFYYDLDLYAATYRQLNKLAAALTKSLPGQAGLFDGQQITQVQTMGEGADDYLEDLELYTQNIEIKVVIQQI